MHLEDLEKQLPYYLTLDQKKGLSEALKNFKERGSGDFCTALLQGETLQGDCWTNVPFYDYHSNSLRKVSAVVISNSCDISKENGRDFPPNITLAPMMKMSSIEAKMQKSGFDLQQIESKLSSIRSQKITNVFYLPCNLNGDEYVVFFDQAQSMPLSVFDNSAEENSFSLSMMGFYLLLFKLSVHYCRFHEEVARP